MLRLAVVSLYFWRSNASAKTLIISPASHCTASACPSELPENTQRVSAILGHLESTGLLSHDNVEYQGTVRCMKQCKSDIDLAFHTAEEAAEMQKLEKGYIANENYFCPVTYDSILHSVHAAAQAARKVFAGKYENAFAVIRPPGHHANGYRVSSRKQLGFCFANNAAAAARAALAAGASRVAIVDVDAHHGDGTEEQFYARSDVLTVSQHLVGPDFFPGSGRVSNVGQDDGHGFNINVVLGEEASDTEALAMLQFVILPILREYQPSIIILGAGFDGMKGDPVVKNRLQFTPAFFAQAVAALKQVQPRIVALLEGGYNYENLASGAHALLTSLAIDDAHEALSWQELGPALQKRVRSRRRYIAQYSEGRYCTGFLAVRIDSFL